jgi:hypothetical protein
VHLTLYLGDLARTPCNFQIKEILEVQPKLGIRVEVSCQAQRGLRRDSAPNAIRSWDHRSFPSLRGHPQPTQIQADCRAAQTPNIAETSRFRYYLAVRPTERASLPTSLLLIGSLTPVSPGDSASPPEVTRCSSVPCCPQTPWWGGESHVTERSAARVGRGRWQAKAGRKRGQPEE